AAGEVLELGQGVEGWAVGDRVTIGTQTPCGQCRECRRGEPHNCDINWGFAPNFPFAMDGKPVASFANVSSFAGEVVVKASQLFAIDDMPPEQGALIGCAVSTGVCASRVLGQVRAEDNVVVFGVGGIGVNAIQGAARIGAHVIAVDANPAKETAARQFGASAFMLADPAQDSASAAAALARDHGPIDLVVECSGAVGAIETALRCTKRGGRVVLIGMSRSGAQAALPLDSFLLGGAVIATMNGGALPDRDYPELIAQARDGRLNLADQVSGVWPLARIAEAIAALKAGEVTRALVDHEV
ncbi:zinc-binding dehydrogenase, partial [Sphingobium sp.]|uniref:zinc-binding dehydrogenase n=1 Tax=Sphingobium sp. TaxID=1912891 RepID=UPI0035C73055